MSIELAVGLGIVAWFGALAALDFAGIPASTPTYPGRPSLRLQPLPEAIARQLVPPNEGGPPPTPLGAEIFLHVMDDYRHSGAPSGLCGLLVEGEFPQPGTWPCDLTLRLGGGAFVLHLEKPELYRDICEAVGSGTIGAPGRAEGVAVVEGVAEAAGLSLSPAASGPGPGPLPVVYIGGPTDQECDVLTIDHAGWAPSASTRLLLFRCGATHAHLVVDPGTVEFLRIALRDGPAAA